MGIEIEGKFRLADPEAMRRRLKELGASRLGAVLEHNTYFDTPDHALRQRDEGLRVRVVEAPDGRSKAVQTWKGPRRPTELKVRPEIEVELSSAEDAAAILRKLGFDFTMSFQKRRESFRLGEARVELDELPELGFFLEIEADEERTVNQVRARLGLEQEPTITSSYIALVAEHLRATCGGRRTELRF